MLPSLRHDAFIRRNHEQGGIDSAHPGQHILNKITMAWDIHESQASSTRQRSPGEAEVDGHLTFFFFAQPIRIDPRQGLHQSRLSVIYMTCRSNYAHRLISHLCIRVSQLSTPLLYKIHEIFNPPCARLIQILHVEKHGFEAAL